MTLFTETATVRTRAVVGEDEYGNDRYGWSEQEYPAWWEDLTSTETNVANELATSGYRLFLPAGTPISKGSKVVLAGETFEVIGDPPTQPGGFVVGGYVKAIVQKTTG